MQAFEVNNDYDVMRAIVKFPHHIVGRCCVQTVEDLEVYAHFGCSRQ
jgi:hypothetical protein